MPSLYFYWPEISSAGWAAESWGEMTYSRLKKKVNATNMIADIKNKALRTK
jgi:hypothetical protein